MRLTGTLVFLLALLQPLASATEFFVSPQGSSGGNGTRSSPWDLDTAFSAVGVVKPGDTIWMGGGIYGDGARTIFHSSIAGTPSQPVVVRQYPGERATVNGGIQVLGPYVWFWGFEITNTFLTRYSLQTGSFPTDIPQATGITP